MTRPPATAKPSQTVAAECSLSGSKNSSGSPQRFLLAVHDGGVEAAAHGGRAGDRVGAGGLGDVDLDVDDGLGAVAGRRDAGILKLGLGGFRLRIPGADHGFIGEDRAHSLPVLPFGPAPGPLRSSYTIRFLPARPLRNFGVFCRGRSGFA